MKWIATSVFCMLFVYLSLAQATKTIPIIVKLIDQPVELNIPNQFNDSTLTISTLKFYVTTTHKDGKPTIQLIDWSEIDTRYLSASMASQLYLGTDSSTNVSGTLDGDLDPIKGMYWAWNSGYINFKLEGYWNNRAEEKFEYHIGGYRQPFETYREIGSVREMTNELTIDLTQIFEFIIKTELNAIMTPGKTAVQFIDALQPCFQLR